MVGVKTHLEAKPILKRTQLYLETLMSYCSEARRGCYMMHCTRHIPRLNSEAF